VRCAVEPQNRLEYDTFMGMPIRYGLGFMLGHRWISLYGHDTPKAFGHIGFTAVTVWADPERPLAVALMTSGKPFITPGQVLWLKHCPPPLPRGPEGGVSPCGPSRISGRESRSFVDGGQPLCFSVVILNGQPAERGAPWKIRNRFVTYRRPRSPSCS